MACEINIDGFLNQGIRGTIYEPVEDSYDRTMFHTGKLPWDDEDYEYYDSIGLEPVRKRRYEIPPSCKRRAGVHSCDAVNYAELTTAKKYLDAVRRELLETVDIFLHFRSANELKSQAGVNATTNGPA